MQPQVKALFDTVSNRVDSLEAEIRRLRSSLEVLRLYDVSLSGSVDAAFTTLSGTVNSAVVSLSGTVDAEFVFISGTIVTLSGSVDRAWKTGDAAVMSSLSTGATASLASLSGTINSGIVSLSGTINSKFASGLRLLGVQEFTGSVIYTPTQGTIAVHGIVVGSGGGGGAGQTIAGAAGGGGGSGEWLEFWYNPGTAVVGQFVNVGFPGSTAAAGNTSGIMIDGITFAAIGGNAGANNGAVASYAEADARAIGTSGSTAFDLFRGSNSSIAAMATSTTTISAYTAGIGGGTPYGRGGRGSGGDAVGGDGIGWGTGGGGGRRGASTNRNGGNGGSGSVILREYGR